MPPFCSLLTSLTTLDLSHNAFDGALPRLPEALTRVDIGHNEVSGTLDVDFCERMTNLEVCFLNNNAIGGKVPIELGHMLALRSLNLSHNRFEGTVPKSVTNLTNITSLDLQGNALEGVTIPQGLEELPHLQYYMGAEGFESYYLQRPKRFDKYKFDLCMHIQKIYAGPTRLAPSASAEARENEERAKERRRRRQWRLSGGRKGSGLPTISE